MLDSVIQRYTEARSQAQALQRRLKTKREQLEALEHRRYLHHEQHHPWVTKVSDRYGRKAELLALLADDAEVRALRAEVDALEERCEAAETQLATMRFSQRERQLQSMQQLDATLGRFHRAVHAFGLAVEHFKQP
jgi:predicted  nucleic acid-binding Zn-ribbon protein